VSRTDDLRVAAKSLWAHRFRSGLSLLSIAIGAFSIVLMSSLAQSGFETLRRGIEELGGARLLLIVPKRPERAKEKAQAFRSGLTRLDQASIFEDLPYLREHTRFSSLHDRSLRADNGKATHADVVAADSRFSEFFAMPLARGRRFTEREETEHASVCLVGSKLAIDLWGGNAVGHLLSFGGVRCQVVGQLDARQRYGIQLGFDWVNLVVLPASTAADFFSEVLPSTLIMARTAGAEHNEVVKRIVNVRISERHHGIDDFALLDFAGILRNFNTVFLVMQLLVGCIAGLALVVGGVGVMNMMLVSVSERVREIGIRKALGAAPRHIRAQFLTEAALLSGSGGVLGASLGAVCAVLASALISHFLDTWTGLLSWLAVLAALLTALATGVFFGWMPARRASALSPVEAMRR
jgi:putative ABC transport system permease protein